MLHDKSIMVTTNIRRPCVTVKVTSKTSKARVHQDEVYMLSGYCGLLPLIRAIACSFVA
jgi:hypothetical protein